VCPKTKKLAGIDNSVHYSLWVGGKRIFSVPKKPTFCSMCIGGCFLEGMKLTIPIHLVKVKFTV